VEDCEPLMPPGKARVSGTEKIRWTWQKRWVVGERKAEGRLGSVSDPEICAGKGGGKGARESEKEDFGAAKIGEDHRERKHSLEYSLAEGKRERKTRGKKIPPYMVDRGFGGQKKGDCRRRSSKWPQ